ncbi:MAG: TolC family protein, partial [Duncaniella sp.]|nr:TolC family protein [Duncaniella sp.]
APSIRLARSGVDISRTAEKLTRSERLPKVGLQAAWSLDGPILVEVPPINRNLSYWYVGVGVSYNLSSLFKTDKSLARSQAATRAASERYDAVCENVNLGVRAEYVRYLEAYEELKTQQKSVELAERNYRTTSTRYSADMALITDMLDAANAKLDAEQQLENARINIIYYYYKLLFITGQI